MSARLSTAIDIGNAANAILQRVKGFDKSMLSNPEDWEENEHIGVEPMLLALSMELALKAWFVFDYDTDKVKRSHNLLKLFELLKPESRDKLEEEFKTSVAPLHPNGLFLNFGIKNVLRQHANAFIDWRYMHERKTMRFEENVFVATLEMVIREFRKRYHVQKLSSPRSEKLDR